jgi:hypothetical protein
VTNPRISTPALDRHKITVYRHPGYGELLDLEDDPGETRNRWDDPAFSEIKTRLLHTFIQAEMRREPTCMPRIAGA